MLSHFDAIVRAGQLLKLEANFAQGVDALDRFGKPCRPAMKRAAQWSAYGIMYHVYKCDAERDTEKGGRHVDVAFQCLCAFDLAASKLFRHTIEYVNDEIWREDPSVNDRRAYCHERVLACMRTAAKRVKGMNFEDRRA